ncbi:hypothetical protein HPB51_019845 [Rhipicephalus microplus]|uniref:Uncharacterized protein n=1 Tax=Rhipicephalus microplus TaxID=6941 RepID=A0A9J6DC02_RHIMP|nr:hypothetical protein HPB51_019845 [Rhipicephalus microplus]
MVAQLAERFKIPGQMAAAPPKLRARWHRRDFSCVHLLGLHCCGHLLSRFATGSRGCLPPLRIDAALGQLRRMPCQEPNAPVSNLAVVPSHHKVLPCTEYASESSDSSQASYQYLTDEPSPHASILPNSNGHASEPSGSHVSRQSSPTPATTEGRLKESSDSSMLLALPEQHINEP